MALKRVSWGVSNIALALLPSCGAFVDNAMAINGSPEMNRPLATEGMWEGRFDPDQKWRHGTYQLGDAVLKPCVTKGANIRLDVTGADVTGRVVTDEGFAFDIVGSASAGAGAWHTGKNTINADLYWRGRDVGDLSLFPGATSNQMRGKYLFRLSPDRNHCSDDAVVTRVSN